MELLHLHSPDGRPLKTFDLAARPRRPLTLGAAPACDLPLPEGPDTLGALLRDEDGWLLAAADPAIPERRLVPGEPVALGPFLFRLECEAAETRATLLWRAGKERLCHAAPLNDGRNVIAWLPDRSAPALNPAIPGNRIGDLFLEGDGLTLVVEDPEGGTSQRLTFAFGDRFAIGPFTGLALPTAEAERALKTRDPLAWPDRRVRLLLRVAVCVGLLLALAMAALARETQTLRQAVAARAPAAVEIAVPAPAPADPLSRDTIVAYGQLFHACLPGLLATPEATTTDDLLAMRAGQLLRALPEEAAERVPLRRKQVFLESLATIKRAVAAGDWPCLGDALATVDADALHYYDGDALLADARALARTFGQDYSALCRELLRGDGALDRLLQEERQSLAKALAARVDGLCGKDGAGTPADIGSLRALARLVRAVATPDALAAARRADGFAATLSADYDRTCRDLLTRYRLERLAGNAAAAEAILGELLALGPADSPFWDWAQRERARTAPKEEPQP